MAVAIPSDSASGERTLVFTRVFNAPRQMVFDAWTDPDKILQWWGPKHHPAVEMTMDARPGGKWRACLRSTEGAPDLWNYGVFKEVTPPERLVFTFAWEEEGERGLETLVTISFAEDGGKTLMTFHQTPFQSDGERDGHSHGWNSTFDRLGELL